MHEPKHRDQTDVLGQSESLQIVEEFWVDSQDVCETFFWEDIQQTNGEYQHLDGKVTQAKKSVDEWGFIEFWRFGLVKINYITLKILEMQVFCVVF